MIENNKINKAKFYAAYFNQPIHRIAEDNPTLYTVTATTLEFIQFGTGQNTSFLQLRDVKTELTAVETIEIALITGHRDEPDELLQRGLEIMENALISDFELPIAVIDYLREQSFLITWKGLSPKKIKNYGWAVTNIAELPF